MSQHQADDVTSSAAPFAEQAASFSRQVGLRLRAVRRQRGLSLDEVERASDGQWSASAVGAYERGFRNLSLPRLRELADFYRVPMSALLGEIDLRDGRSGQAERIVLDLVALDDVEDAAPVVRYVRGIVSDRGDWNGRVLSIRRDDARVLSCLLDVEEDELLRRLTAWGALAPTVNGEADSADLGELTRRT